MPACGRREEQVRAYGEISSDLVATEKALRKIKGEHGVLHVAYEAGPTGFVLYRRLQQLRAIAWKAQVRLHQRGWHLLRRGVMKPKINVALARELVGFVWDLLRQVPVAGSAAAQPPR